MERKNTELAQRIKIIMLEFLSYRNLSSFQNLRIDDWLL